MPPYPTVARSPGRACLLAVILLLAPAAAAAHASLTPDAAAATATVRLALTIPHGCDGAPTVEVRVEVPEGFVAAQPMAKPGWSIGLEMGPYARSYEVHGDQVAEGLRAVTWSGGELPDAQFDEFVLRGTVADLPPGSVLAFPTTQLCAGGGSVAWVEVPAAGEHPHALTHPAPSLRVVAAEGASGHGGHAGPPAAGEASAGAISVSGAFARASVTPTGAVYLTIRNAGDVPDRLLEVASPAAARVMLHGMSEVDGVMRMEPVAEVELPAQASVALEPGGMHVMLMGLTAPLAEGAELTLTLGFEHAGALTVVAPILGPGAGPDDLHEHGEH